MDEGFFERLEEFEGYRFNFEGKSLVVHAMAWGERLSAAERTDLTRALSDVMAGLGKTFRPARPHFKTLYLDDTAFPPARGRAFKIVTPEGHHHLERGSFRLGSPAYFAGLDSADARNDPWEGYATVFAEAGGQTFCTATTAGYNCVAFCTTKARDRRRLKDLRLKFGGADGSIVVIKDVEGLQAALAARLPPARTMIADVRYSDAVVTHLIAGEDRLLSGTSGDLTRAALHEINKRCGAKIYADALMASLFTKSLSYAHEAERRLVFEFAEDLGPDGYIDVNAPEAVQFLEFK